MSQQKGFQAEELARKYLVSQGLVWINSNFRAPCGEIDLIMRDSEVIVFVEVRARRSQAFGGGCASVTVQKQKKLIKTASWYLLKHRMYEHYVTRFDVMSFDGEPPVMTWIKDAFYCH